MQSKCASDQTPAGWNIEIRRVEVISTPCKVGEGGASKGAPLSDIEVVAVSRESTGRVSSRDALGALMVPGVLNLRPSTSRLLCLTCGIFAPLLRVRSISCMTLGLLGEGAERVRVGRHTFPNPRVPPSRTR